MTNSYLVADSGVAEAALLGAALLVFVTHGIWLWAYAHWSIPYIRRARHELLVALDSAEALSTSKVRFPPALLRRLQFTLLRDFSRNLDLAHDERLTQLAETIGLLDRARRLCASRKWWRRLEGIRMFSALESGEDVVPALMNDRNPLVRAQSAEWGVGHPTVDTVRRLLPLINDPAPIAARAAQDALIRMGALSVVPLVRFLSERSGSEVTAALRVAAHIADPQLLPSVLQHSNHASPEARALVIRLAGALGGEESIAVLERFLSDSSPEVRAAAAHAVGRLRYWPASGHLSTLLRDSAWIVRREAGLALATLGAPGILLLRRSLQDDDPFAADMARQVLDLPATITHLQAAI